MVIASDGLLHPTLTLIMDSFSCSQLLFYFEIEFEKSLQYHMMSGR